MSIPLYSARVTNNNGVITAWVDKDGSLCIEQPNLPELLHTEETWSSEEAALQWAQSHAAELTNSAELNVQAEAAKAEAEALDRAAKEATIANAAKLDEIYEMLSNLTNR
jgi:hypothetical protein